MKKVTKPPSIRIENQKKRLLAELRKVGKDGLSTIEIRQHKGLRIMDGPAIVRFLRRDGFNIKTIWREDENAQGNKHRCARYILFPGKWKKPTKKK